MAIDPRISLATQTVDTNQLFSQNLANLRAQDALNFNRQIMPLQLEQAQRQNQLEQAQQGANLQQALNQQQLRQIEAIGMFADQAVNIDDPVEVSNKALQMAEQAKRFGLDGSSFVGISNFALQNPSQLKQHLIETQRERDAIFNTINSQRGQQPIKNQLGVTKTVKDEQGNLFFSRQSVDPITNESTTILTAIDNSDRKPVGKTQLVNEKGQTIQEEQKQELEQLGKKEAVKLKAKRTNELIKDLSTQNRLAKKQDSRLSSAINILQKQDFTGGITARTKQALAKVFPGIDVSDIGTLDSLFKQLALDSLQAFKGPTTDFEFRIAQSIAGDVSDPKSANIARLKSLQRARFFTEKQWEQFKKWRDAGKDPDEFAFDFNETIDTKKGKVTLKQLRDTAAFNNITIEELLDKLNGK